jgi:hypothetical protein
MDDQQDRTADELMALAPDQEIELKRFAAYLKGAVDALRVLACRSYISPEQAALISTEAGELDEKDIAPLRKCAPRRDALPSFVDEDRGVLRSQWRGLITIDVTEIGKSLWRQFLNRLTFL